ncbi:MAG: arsenate reductase [Planctomycetota bacterium]|nr:MAG: arsenate reductase [Planctomycetota bacterium]
MRILFLCTENACRSQMAEHWANHLATAGGLAGSFASAGTNPTSPNPRMLQVMAESGIDCGQPRSRHLNDFVDSNWDLAVTLCDAAADSCPAFTAAKRFEHHPFPNPAQALGSEEEILREFRAVSLQIRDWVAMLIEEMS